MIANEVTMVRNLSPRLLHKGNYGFTTEEMMEAMSEIAPGASKRPQDTAKNLQLDAHANRQLEMEGQAISDPAMFPLAGRHGATSDTPIVEAAAPPAGESAVQPPAPAAAQRGSPGSASSAEELEPSLQHYHWSNFQYEGENSQPVKPVEPAEPGQRA
jgi:hypothetical protein